MLPKLTDLELEQLKNYFDAVIARVEKDQVKQELLDKIELASLMLSESPTLENCLLYYDLCHPVKEKYPGSKLFRSIFINLLEKTNPLEAVEMACTLYGQIVTNTYQQ